MKRVWGKNKHSTEIPIASAFFPPKMNCNNNKNIIYSQAWKSRKQYQNLPV